MESYFEKGKKLKDTSTTFNTHIKGARLKETSTTLNPQAKEYLPAFVDSNQHAYRNATQTNSQDVQLNKTKHGKTISKPLLDAHVQLTTPNVNQSQIPLQINDETSALCNLLQRQNDISILLIQQQTAHLLPPREIPSFDGDPLQYRTFIRAFEHCVERNASSNGDCLYFLDRYTRSQPKDLVRSCQHMAPDRGYTIC